jgi:hypothetical protein
LLSLEFPVATFCALQGILPIEEYVAVMWFLNLNEIARWFFTNGDGLALLITAGVAILVFSCVGCSCNPSEEEDDIFHQQTM